MNRELLPDFDRQDPDAYPKKRLKAVAGRLATDPEYGEVMRRAFGMYARGDLPKDIEHTLLSNGEHRGFNEMIDLIKASLRETKRT